MIAIEVLASSKMNARVLKISKGPKQLSTPSYFPAISRSRMHLPADAVLTLVLSVVYPRVLVSTYDFSQMARENRAKVLGEISNYFRNGSFVMLDSGIFESCRNHDAAWTFKQYAKWVRSVDSDFYFSYDVLPHVSNSDERLFERTLSQIRRSKSVTGSSECIPVVHGLTPKQLIRQFRKLVFHYPQFFNMISVTERDCGKTLSERATTILSLRRILKERHADSPIHVLGCGDPISIALYTYCGADTFDSLDWSEMVFDRNELRIVNLSQLELLRCDCKACKRPIKDPQMRALLHNLRFYQDYGMKLQTMTKRGTLRDYLIEFVGLELMESVDKYASKEAPQ
jgi:queuine/archaeosine tRNA-ribosyltransferase